jgi:hypothetical protein
MLAISSIEPKVLILTEREVRFHLDVKPKHDVPLDSVLTVYGAKWKIFTIKRIAFYEYWVLHRIEEVTDDECEGRVVREPTA